MGIKQLYNDNLRKLQKLLNEYGDISVMSADNDSVQPSKSKQSQSESENNNGR